MKNACVVGCGNIGPVHASAIAAAENVRLFAVCDKDPERAEKYAKQYGAEAIYDFDEVCKNPSIDSVHICTPHYLHVPMAIAAARAEKDVVLEKPASINSEEFLRLQRELSGKRVCVMLQNRMNTAVSEFKRIICESAELGALIGGFASMTWQRTREYYEADEWRGKWATEGGALLINQAIHLIDLVSYLAGDIKSVCGSISNKTLSGIIEAEDTADAIFSLAGGAKVCYYATNGYSGYQPMRLELEFENALLRYADDCLYRIEKGNKGSIEILARNSEAYAGKKYWGNSHMHVIDNFYNGGEYPTLANAENSMRALFAFYESAKRGAKEVPVGTSACR